MSEPTDEMQIDIAQDGDTAFTFREEPAGGEIRFLANLEETVDFLTRSWWRRTLLNLAGGGKLVAVAPFKERKKRREGVEG